MRESRVWARRGRQTHWRRAGRWPGVRPHSGLENIRGVSARVPRHLCTIFLAISVPYSMFPDISVPSRSDIYKWISNRGLMYSTIKVWEWHPRPHHEGATVFARR